MGLVRAEGEGTLMLMLVASVTAPAAVLAIDGLLLLRPLQKKETALQVC